ncbi:MAG: Fic family protein [Chloroflexota bacterium]|nr:Fic family protein [Chloroflexota bacterium]
MIRHSKDSARAGRYVEQTLGYRAFFPKPLPPNPPLEIDEELIDLLSKANRALGKLEGVTQILPDPDMFLSAFVRKESLLSSQIEGTQASLDDVLAYEAVAKQRGSSSDAAAVINYTRAMNHGIDRIAGTAIGPSLFKDIHTILLKGARGGKMSPGEFRTGQNWVGPSDSDIYNSVYIPPPPTEIEGLMANIETYLEDQDFTPALLKCGVAHSQFETIHPFLDGNGRIGRLLVTLYLCKRGVISRPLLYLSVYFKQNRTEYYERLQQVRDSGDWEGWLKFFLRGVWLVSEETYTIAQKIIAMREEHRQLISDKVRSPGKGLVLLEELYRNPAIFIPEVAALLKVTYPAANAIISDFVKNGLLTEITGNKRNRLFFYEPYIGLLRKGTEPIEQ